MSARDESKVAFESINEMRGQLGSVMNLGCAVPSPSAESRRMQDLGDLDLEDFGMTVDPVENRGRPTSSLSTNRSHIASATGRAHVAFAPSSPPATDPSPATDLVETLVVASGVLPSSRRPVDAHALATYPSGGFWAASPVGTSAATWGF